MKWNTFKLNIENKILGISKEIILLNNLSQYFYEKNNIIHVK